MRVLLLHPEDTPPRNVGERWDLIVDLARAPQQTCKKWANHAGCDVISLYQFAEEVDDLYLLRALLQSGMGELVDEAGIDWWDVMSLEFLSELRGILLTRRLAQKFGPSCELYSTRPHALATSLQHWLGVTAISSEGLPLRMSRQAHRWSQAISRLDRSQLVEIVSDKSAHLFAAFKRERGGLRGASKPIVLCPTAYVNSSRIAVSLARALPGLQFAFVYTRANGKLSFIPPNVQQSALAHQSRRGKHAEFDTLLSRWQILRQRLIDQHPEFENADKTGILSKMPGLLRWGIELRDAWIRVFESRNITACLCADDSNPPTRIPLILSTKRGLPGIAVHHGALDYAMAVKIHHADFYLTKSEIEHDYLQRTCRVPGEKLVRVELENYPDARSSGSPDSLVFFTEPYEHFGWRRNEVYRDLMPRLCDLAGHLNLKLVFKLHPFESVAWFQKMLKRWKHDQRIEVISGPLTTNFLQTAKVALTVQSSVAIECSKLNIPVFLFTWLRDSLTGYAHQLSRFGAGWPLESSDEIEKIPELLKTFPSTSSTGNQGVSPEILSHLFPKATQWLSLTHNCR